MKQIINGLLTIMLLGLLSSCYEYEETPQSKKWDNYRTEWREYRLADRSNYSQIPQEEYNPITYAKVDVGRDLFFEKAIAINTLHDSGLKTFSCATCHKPGASFYDSQPVSIADGHVEHEGFGRVPDCEYEDGTWDFSVIRTPTAINGAYSIQGGAAGQFGFEEQVTIDMIADFIDRLRPEEYGRRNSYVTEGQGRIGLGHHRNDVSREAMLEADPEYEVRLQAAFPEVHPDSVCSPTIVGFALAAYERTLITSYAPFQLWLGHKLDHDYKDAKIDVPYMLQGAELFFEKFECNSCHNQPAFQGDQFYNMQFAERFKGNAERIGRMKITKEAADKYRKSVPQLYNLKHAPTYGHSMGTDDLGEIILGHFVPQDTTKSENVDIINDKPIPTPQELAAMRYFLEYGCHDESITELGI